jgi:hypothetical protein
MAQTARTPEYNKLSIKVWTELMGRGLDEVSPSTPLAVKEWIKGAFQTYAWTNVFDIIEFTFKQYEPLSYRDKSLEELRNAINETLSDFSSPWRIIGDGFAPISDEQQVKEIDAALNVPLKPVKEHLENALQALREPSPTAARDSIRESIHAVESMCGLLTGETNESLGKALNKLKGKIAIPGELENVLHKLYGFTSNSEGVRHAVFDEAKVTLREARLMVVTCSAFITYLWDLAILAGLIRPNQS